MTNIKTKTVFYRYENLSNEFVVYQLLLKLNINKKLFSY